MSDNTYNHRREIDPGIKQPYNMQSSSQTNIFKKIQNKLTRFYKKLFLILWKNYTIRKKSANRTLIEIFLPTLIFLITINLSSWLVVGTWFYPECHFQAYAMPSAGLIPWFQSMLCNKDSTCRNKQESSTSIPGQVIPELGQYSKEDVEFFQSVNYNKTKILNSKIKPPKLTLHNLLGDVNCVFKKLRRYKIHDFVLFLSPQVASVKLTDKSKKLFSRH